MMKLLRGSEIEGDDLASRYVRDAWDALRSRAIANVDTEMAVFDTGRHRFPISIGVPGPGQCYVAAPSSAFTDYSREEIRRVGRPWLTWPLIPVVESLRLLLRWMRVDQLVQVNNWLLSTNVYPLDWTGDDLGELTEFLIAAFPASAIAFRSLNREINGLLMERFEALGYLLIPTRQVYIYDAREGFASSFVQRHNFKIDAQLLKRTPYQVVSGREIKAEEFPRLIELYRLLYLEKYSYLNPQYTAEWLKCGQRDGWLELSALRRPDGVIDGVVGWFGHDAVLTAPVVGYDTALPAGTGLFRLLTQLCLQRTLARRCILNFSSGAARFKRLRGGQPQIEYSLVYIRHLSRARQAGWRALSAILHRIGVPFMEKMEL